MVKTISDQQRLRRPVSGKTLSLTALSLALFGAQMAVAGPTINLGDETTLDYSLTASYTASMRVAKPASEYLNSPNNDDGTRNFKRGSLVNNRANLLGDLHLKHRNMGALVRGSTFYDAAYRSHNDNNSPGTVNKYGNNKRFIDETRDISGQTNRLLDAFVYGNWAVGDQQYLSLKAGRHTLAWGESMFWPNISQGQAPVDATVFNVPGTEAKEGYLPVGQISGSFTVNPIVTLTGFYQYKWEPTRLNPIGDYFSTFDAFGPGSQFMITPGFNLPYAGEVKPSDSGQWGLGARFQVGTDTEVGLYHYRYHDRVGSMLFDNGGGDTQYSSFNRANFGGQPGSYKLAYFDDIKLTGVSLSTKFGDSVQMGTDLSYRQDASVAVDIGPARGDIFQGNLNFVYMMGPNPIAHQTTLMGELVYTRIQSVDTLRVTGTGFDPVTFVPYPIDIASGNYVYNNANGEQTRANSLIAFGALFDHPSVFPGWDLATQAIWTQNIAGSANNAAGLGRGEKRLTLGTTLKYLGNFSVGLQYVSYLSSPDLRLGRSMADRDYVSFSLKHTF